jgi:hypothetical protein
MSYTKRQFVTAAFEEIGLASYVFDLQPQTLQTGVKRLDAMMAQWNARGIRLGYPIASNPDNADLDTDTGVPDSANEAIICNLAMALAPGFGKSMAADTKARAKTGLNTLQARAAVPPEMQFPGTLPAGAGNKPWSIYEPFLPRPVDPVLAGDDGPIDWN